VPLELEDVSEAVPPLHIVVAPEMLMEGSATTVTVTTLEYAAQLPKLAFLTYFVVVVSAPGS
jgi:uncharacterized membrane protein